MTDTTTAFGQRRPRVSMYVSDPTPDRFNHNHSATGVAAADDALSDRERQVLALMGRGFTNKEAAQRLGIAPETIKSHIKHIFRKLAVERRAHAVSRGHSLGLIDFARD